MKLLKLSSRMSRGLENISRIIILVVLIATILFLLVGWPWWLSDSSKADRIYGRKWHTCLVLSRRYTPWSESNSQLDEYTVFLKDKKGRMFSLTDEDDSSRYTIAGKSAYINVKVSEHQINPTESSFFLDPDVDGVWMGFGVAIIFICFLFMFVLSYGGSDGGGSSGWSVSVSVNL